MPTESNLDQIRKEIESVLHLVGCQNYDAGYTHGRRGLEHSLTQVEEREETTLNEVMEVVRKALYNTEGENNGKVAKG